MMSFLLLLNIGAFYIASGSPSGTYYRIAHAIADVWQNAGYKTNVIKTGGSIENLRLLLQDSVQFALIQNDVIANAISNNPALMDSIFAVIPVYYEVLQIVAYKDINASDITSLTNRRVIPGYPGSGTAFTAKRLIDLLLSGISMKMVLVRNGNELLRSMLEREADAVFFVSKVPDPLVAYIMAQGKFSLVPFHSRQLKKLKDEIGKNFKKLYFPYTIKGKTYPYQYRSVTTLAIPAVLVTRWDVDSSTINKMFKAIINDLNSRHSKLKLFIGKKGLREVAGLSRHVVIKYHPGALPEIKKFRGVGFWVKEYFHFIIWAGIFLLSFTCFLVTTFSRIREFFIDCLIKFKIIDKVLNLIHNVTYWRIAQAVSIFLMAWIGGAFLLYHFESSVNDSFSTIPNSFISVIVYFFSGFEDRMPVTNGGWVISTLMLIVGIVTAAFITGEFASFLLLEKMEEKIMSQDMGKKAFVIIGWNSGSIRVINELRSAMQTFREDHKIVVISDHKIDSGKFKELGVKFFSADTFDKDALAQLGVHLAESIIVMADENSEDPDAKSVMSVLAARKLIEEKHNNKEINKLPLIIVEAKNHRKMKTIKDAGADAVICHEDFGLGVIAQSAMDKKASDVYQELLHYDPNTNEIYIVRHNDIPEELKKELNGKTFKEASRFFIERREKLLKNPCILVGFYKKDSEVLLNPRPDNEGNEPKFEDGDGLIFIAWEKPDLNLLL